MTRDRRGDGKAPGVVETLTPPDDCQDSQTEAYEHFREKFSASLRVFEEHYVGAVLTDHRRKAE